MLRRWNIRACDRRPGVGPGRRSGARGVGLPPAAWSPAQLSGLHDWWEDQAVGDPMDTITDRSGVGNHLTTAGTTKPNRRALDYNSNGRPAFVFLAGQSQRAGAASAGAHKHLHDFTG